MAGAYDLLYLVVRDILIECHDVGSKEIRNGHIRRDTGGDGIIEVCLGHDADETVSIFCYRQCFETGLPKEMSYPPYGVGCTQGLKRAGHYIFHQHSNLKNPLYCFWTFNIPLLWIFNEWEFYVSFSIL